MPSLDDQFVWMDERYEELGVACSQNDIIMDLPRWQALMKERAGLEQAVTDWREYRKLRDEIASTRELLDSPEMADMAQEELPQLLTREEELRDRLRRHLIPRDPNDERSVVMEIRAGAGGDEASLFGALLMRMYARYAERMGFKIRELDMLDGDEAGIKSVTFEVSGDYAYGYLKCERGVHRLVRISPFDANARRHTSFASLDVAPVIEDDGKVDIRQEDLRIDTYRASGAGGQHVNRTDSAVRITHIPTGVVVQCQNERSQVQNKETCFRMLRAKLAELKEKQRQEQMGDIKGEQKKIEWGSQIRSYVFQPYTLVKDLRTGYEMGDVDAVMDGKLEGFVTAYLQMLAE